MSLTFVVPGALDQLTGGFLFDRHIVEGLRALGRAIDVRALPGDFPEVDAATRRAAAALLAALPDAALVVIDGLALPAFADCLLPQASRLKLIGFVHHPLALETGLDAEARARLAGLEARLLARMRGVLCPSAATAWVLEEYGVARGHIAITPPGTRKPAGPPRRASHDGPLRLLCVGAVTPRKGHLLLVDALAELADRAWELRCLGSLTRDPDAAEALTRAIARHGLGGRVSLLGEWPSERLGAAYAEADIFVLPSYLEGYGMAFAEALAYGLPIVCTTAGAIPETVPGAAAMLVPPGDRAALTDALRFVIDNAPLRARLAAGAAAAGAALPDWPAATRGWIDALDRLIA
jgi:glycosyltransferase involved in cell wall biosynthesis